MKGDTLQLNTAGTVHLYDAQAGPGSPLHLAAAHAVAPGRAEPSADPVGAALVAQVSDTGQCVSVLETDYTYLGVPLLMSSQVVGVLSVYECDRAALTPERVSLLIALAEPISVAIERARLLEQAERSAALEERQRMARELHDSVTQLIYSLYLKLETQRRTPRPGHTSHAAELEPLSDIAHQALKELRLLVFELRPLELERVGLVEGLRQRLETVERRAGLDVRLNVEDADAHLADYLARPHVEESLYRIAQEALNNALKHAAATAVTVHFRVDGERLQMEVADNGRGFDPAARPSGQGLHTMRERVEQVGGRLRVRSAPGEGTQIQAMVLHSRE